VGCRILLHKAGPTNSPPSAGGSPLFMLGWRKPRARYSVISYLNGIPSVNRPNELTLQSRHQSQRLQHKDKSGQAYVNVIAP
jgi:hypothetical protein